MGRIGGLFGVIILVMVGVAGLGIALIPAALAGAGFRFFLACQWFVQGRHRV